MKILQFSAIFITMGASNGNILKLIIRSIRIIWSSKSYII